MEFEYQGITFTRQADGSWRGSNGVSLSAAEGTSLMGASGGGGGGSSGSPTATQVFAGDQGYGRYQYNPSTQRYDIFLGAVSEGEPQGSYRPVGANVYQGPDGRLGKFVTQFQGGQQSQVFRPLSAQEEQQFYAAQNAPREPTVHTNISVQDPRALDLQAQQLAQSWEQFRISTQQADAQFAQRIAQDQAQLNFLMAKHADEMRLGEQASARQTIALMEQIQARLSQDEFQRVSLQQQAMATNAQFQMQAAQLNEQARVANLQQRQSVARDIAEFTRSPGDVGAAAGFLRAGGGSPISTALAEGETAITPQSLAILNNMLAVSDEVMRDPQQIQAPQIQMPQFTPSEPLDVAGLLAQLTAPPAQETQTAFQPEWIKNEQGTGYWAQDEQGKWVGYVPGGPGVVNKNVLDRGWELPTFEKGGILDGVGIVGDSSDGKPNEEVVIGNAQIIPLDDFTPEQRKRIKKALEGYQDGGVIGNPLLRAQNFLDDAAALAMQMGGFNRVPTPVQMATPGQSPWLQQLAAATTATARGIPQELFQEEIARVTPRGLTDSVVRRTR